MECRRNSVARGTGIHLLPLTDSVIARRMLSVLLCRCLAHCWLCCYPQNTPWNRSACGLVCACSHVAAAPTPPRPYPSACAAVVFRVLHCSGSSVLPSRHALLSSALRGQAHVAGALCAGRPAPATPEKTVGLNTAHCEQLTSYSLGRGGQKRKWYWFPHLDSPAAHPPHLTPLPSHLHS